MATTTKKPAKRKSAADKDARDRSAVWHSLKYVAGKNANSAARDLLIAGETIDVRLSVEGTVGEKIVAETVIGQLQVGHDEPTSTSTTPDQDHLVALLLERMPKTKSDELLATLPATYTQLGTLPEVSDEKRNQAKALLEQLRSRTPSTRRGTVRFQHQPAAAT